MAKYPYLLIAVFVLFGCKKTTNVTNNVPITNQPGFTVQGLAEIRLSRINTYAEMSMSVVYHDSIQEKVTLEFSPLPSGIILADNWTKSGYPTFSNRLLFFDSNRLDPAIPGTYPITLNATGSQTGLKKFTFNIIVDDIQSVSGPYIGIYSNCSATTVPVYRDTIEQDASITNKVWLKNFCNTGKNVAAIFEKNNSGSIVISIPPQIIDGMFFSGSGTTLAISASGYKLRITAQVNSTWNTINM